MKKNQLLTLLALSSFSGVALAQEYPLGLPIIKNGMEIQGVYLQPVIMDTDKGMRKSIHDSDIHLEADIHAVEENPHGFAEGDWIPYLLIKYSVDKLGDDKPAQKGRFMPMVASDGPHYGKNIKLDGNGKYKVTFTIYPPSYNKNAHFGRHIDKETGVAPWYKPFNVSWTFNYAGVGRKGSY